MKNRWKLFLPVMLAFGILLLCSHYHISAEQILSWKPDNLYLAAVLLLCLYAVKSILVFFPIMIPEILAGHLYPPVVAIVLNLLGLTIVMALPHQIGKRRGTSKMEALVGRYPKIRSVLNRQNENQMVLCFMLRACSVPPADIVTMYLGATGMPFLTNIIGGVLGCLPGMLLTTFLGANIRNPESPAFWLALGLNVAWILLSALAFYLYKCFSAGKEESA